jgi:ADP-heptose:LPS heptosyltransferase
MSNTSQPAKTGQPTGAGATPFGQRAKAGNILVIKLGAMGDFMLSLGAMAAIRSHHPAARITLLTTPPFKDFAAACPYFDAVDVDGREREPKKIIEMLRRIRNQKFDIVYDLQNNSRTERYFLGMMPKPPPWNGTVAGASLGYTDPERTKLHTIERLSAQVIAGGIPAPPSGVFQPKLDWIRRSLRDPPRLQPSFFGLKGPFALLVPGASAHRDAKRWSPERYAGLAQWLATEGVTPVLLGAKAEASLATEIVRAVGVRENIIVNLVSRTDMFQIATLAERALVVIGNDTGPMHMATLAGCSGVALFAISESNPELSRPRGPREVIVVTGEKVADISVSDVAQAIRALPVWQSRR